MKRKLLSLFTAGVMFLPLACEDYGVDPSLDPSFAAGGNPQRLRDTDANASIPADTAVSVDDTIRMALYAGNGNLQNNKNVVWTNSNPAAVALTPSKGTAIAAAQAPGTSTVCAALGANGSCVVIHVSGGPANTAPNANDDAFDAIGNVTIPVPAPGVLANDTDAETTVTAVPGPITTANGGTVEMSADGSFTYLSAAGFSGTDSFTYQATDGTDTDNATVTVSVNGRVWYAKNDAAAPGDGRDASPFVVLKDAELASAAGEMVLVFEGNGTSAGYSDGFIFKAGQSLIGQGISADLTAIVNGVTVTLLEAADYSRISRSGDVAIALATDNTLRGIAVASSNGAGIAGTSFGTFTGAEVSVETSAATAVSLTGGGTAVFTGADNTISSTGGVALNVVNASIGAAGMQFRSISANGASNGIVLSNTGTLGGLSVTGNGTPGSGGTIQNIAGGDALQAGNGIWLEGTSSVSLSHMQMNDFDNHAVRGTGVNGFALRASVVNGLNGNNAALFEGSIVFDNLTGSGWIQSTTVEGGLTDNLRVHNTSGILNRLTIDGSTIGLNNALTGRHGVFVQANGPATANLTVQSTSFLGARGSLLLASAIGNGQTDVVLTASSFSNTHPNTSGGGGNVVIDGFGAATVTYNVTNNTFRGALGNAFAVSQSSGAGQFTGTVDNNDVGVGAIANSGSAQGSGLSFTVAGGGTFTTAITNNRVRQYNNHGILLQIGDATSGGTGVMNATATGNTISNPGTAPSAKNGIHLNAGLITGDAHTVCLDLGGAGTLANAITGSGSGGAAGTDFRLRQRMLTKVTLPGYVGANNDNAAVTLFVQSRNGVTPTGLTQNNVAGGAPGYVNGAACPTS